MSQKRTTGPVGSSCLTCKRRRKKCDQGRPACHRCTKGGFECLGYDHIRQRIAAGSSSAPIQRGPIENTIHAPANFRTVNSNLLADNAVVQSLAVPIHEYSEATPYCPNGCHTLTHDAIGRPFTAEPRLIIPAARNSLGASLLSILGASSSSSSEYNESHPNRSRYNRNNPSLLLSAQAARTLSTLSPNVRQSIYYVINQYERVLESAYFKPKPAQILRMRELVATRLQASSITRCSVLLSAKMVDSFLNGQTSNRITFEQSVQRFENQLQVAKARHPNSFEYPIEFQYILNGLLEVAFMKMRISNGYHAYQLLHDAAPTFLEIVSSDPNLWSDTSGPPTACLSKIATSTRFELGHFALMDIICSVAYGLPQVVGYETTTIVPEVEIHPIEWVHGCPLEFQICVAEMNQRCAMSRVAPDWHVIEYRLLSYKPPAIIMDNTESWKTVARLAVLESWRQVLLIYLYMAVCGALSDDHRVQSAVRQTFQLFKAVEKDGPSKVNFMFQYLIAGACARNENQRAFVRERLLTAFDHECWLVPGCELVPVLDHLWYGVAVSGQPFRWSDYITSRQVALPIPI